jgi:hypothetical protein
MDKDYAKYFYSNKQNHSRFVDVFLVLLLVLIVSGLIYAAYVHDHTGAKQRVSEWALRIKLLFGYHQQAIEKKMQPVSAAKEPDIRFDFYTKLPVMQVAPAPKTVIQAMPAAQTAERSLYFLQLGVFKSQTAASQIRLSLLLSGIDADIVKVMLDNKMTYHIYHGRYADKKQAEMAQLKLKQKGIESIIRKG